MAIPPTRDVYGEIEGGKYQGGAGLWEGGLSRISEVR